MAANKENILEFLPRTDCEMCGMTCSDFADYLLSGDLSPTDCPVLHEEQYAGHIEALEEILATLAEKAATGLLIEAEKCNGCGICVAVCEYNAANSESGRMGRGPRVGEKVALRVDDGCIKLVDESLCTRLIQAADKCSKCVDHCPTKAISLI
ncbi:MAG: 4Fe-4S binding protein [Deltaproteobacteria bacterium]|nr:4Fe-4S binding protein [Deltaproteobacteria bacterium]MBW2069643.1 4Fe-4S binding protein [Deltaproteobacteria bacterium]